MLVSLINHMPGVSRVTQRYPKKDTLCSSKKIPLKPSICLFDFVSGTGSPPCKLCSSVPETVYHLLSKIELGLKLDVGQVGRTAVPRPQH